MERRKKIRKWPVKSANKAYPLRRFAPWPPAHFHLR
jgi:hypothetical protein